MFFLTLRYRFALQLIKGWSAPLLQHSIRNHQRFLLFSSDHQRHNDPHLRRFPYYSLHPLPENNALPASQFHFNEKEYHPEKNPYGQLDADSSHTVYRAKERKTELAYYVKNLNQSKVVGERSPELAQFIAYKEMIATRLMYLIFGPEIIPNVLPIKHDHQWGIVSSEMKYLGTHRELAEQLGYHDSEVRNDPTHCTPIKIINGSTFLHANGQYYRIKHRIAFKIALGWLLAHYDIDNHHNNVFWILTKDHLNFRTVARPGMFDLGNVFANYQMDELLALPKHSKEWKVYVDNLATHSIDAHVPELLVDQHEKINDRYLAKEAAYRRIAELPLETINCDFQWVYQHCHPESVERFQKIEAHIKTVREISKDVADTLIEQHFSRAAKIYAP